MAGARGSDRVEAGWRPPHTRRRRSRRAEAVRSTPDDTRVWQVVPEEPAADADHARTGRRARVLRTAYGARGGAGLVGVRRVLERQRETRPNLPRDTGERVRAHRVARRAA